MEKIQWPSKCWKTEESSTARQAEEQRVISVMEASEEIVHEGEGSPVPNAAEMSNKLRTGN